MFSRFSPSLQADGSIKNSSPVFCFVYFPIFSGSNASVSDSVCENFVLKVVLMFEAIRFRETASAAQTIASTATSAACYQFGRFLITFTIRRVST